MSIYKILPAGAALILIIGITSTLLFSPVNAAEAMVDEALQKVESLSLEQLEQMKQRMNLQGDNELISLLKNAKSASDLKIVESVKISCGEVEKITEAQKNTSGVDVSTPGMKVDISGEAGVKVNMPGIDFNTSGDNVAVNMPGINFNTSGSAQNKIIEKTVVGGETYSNFTIVDAKKGCKNPLRWDFKGESSDKLVLIDANNSQVVTYLEYTQNGTRMVLALNQNSLPLKTLEYSSFGSAFDDDFMDAFMEEDGDTDENSEDENFDFEDEDKNETDSNEVDESSDLNVDASGIDVNISDEDKDGNADVNLNMPGMEAEVIDNGDGDNADVNVNMPGIDFSTSGDNVEVKMPGIDFSTGGF